MPTLSNEHQKQLQEAKLLLENPGVASKISNYIGAPIELGLDQLPVSWNEGLQDVVETALHSAADAAIFTIEDTPGVASSNNWHKFGVAASGGVGGFFGLAAIAVELPISTTIMLRSMADIARSEGESVDNLATKIACIEVFALGGTSKQDDGTELGYYAVRAALAKAVSEAAQHLSRAGVTQTGSPALVRLIARVSQYFGVQVSQKIAAQAVPAIGAFGGAIINTVFIDHFQDMARGHFAVRRLERIYGPERIEDAYFRLPARPEP
ncbi:LasA [Luminiphilus syltensis NOR5-1B]|uniref:LasA n=1 Tax=Luminiphilus syltensis NOR5-1B TaxID=565045 RepID=B8KVQ0_9GAMM|nr:EcsC family protein [Luminiphilus syltensis]EED36026.1 LasA [Luminiphilus syltensis NOR5-1B]EED36407.1 LasA [Luminiphilus syltensis NOR5-1B]